MSNPFAPDDSPVPPRFTDVPAGGAGNPFPPAQSVPDYRPVPTVSILAILSLIAGLGGFITCCCWPLSAPMSLVAIICGHIAAAQIKGSQGRQQGLPVAYGGLALGYTALVMMIAFVLWGILGPKAAPVPVTPMSPEKAKLNQVELSINTDDNGVAQGNSPEAIALARKFTKLMTDLRETMFTKRKEGALSMSGNKFITYCELHDGKCVFVVHVPAYKNFTSEAKASLAEIAWAAAQKSAEGTLQEGDDLGVGMKGVILYGKVMVGKVVDDPADLKSGIERESSNHEEWLLPFFEEPVRAEAEMP